MQSKSKRKNRTSSVYTVFSISLVLFFLGVFGWIVLKTNDLQAKVKEEVQVDLYFRDGINDNEMLKLEKELRLAPYVTSAKFISKDSAAAQMGRLLGDDAFEIIDYNPLHALIEVRFDANFVDVDSVKVFEAEIMARKNSILEEVYYNRAQFLTVQKGMAVLKLVILVLAGILLVVAIALINNTIRLAIFSQRFLIKTMQLVGARHRFIRKPFLQQSLLQGSIGGILSIGLFCGLMFGVAHFMPSVILSGNETQYVDTIRELGVQKDFQIFVILFSAIILGGMFISYLSTFFALRRYIRLETSQLH